MVVASILLDESIHKTISSKSFTQFRVSLFRKLPSLCFPWKKSDFKTCQKNRTFKFFFPLVLSGAVMNKFSYWQLKNLPCFQRQNEKLSSATHKTIFKLAANMIMPRLSVFILDSWLKVSRIRLLRSGSIVCY